MEQILEKVMNFINENTMLLIIICIFLIIILIIYLIDNTIKSKKLEKEELNKKNENEGPTILENPIPEKEAEEPKVEEIPVVPVEEPKVEEVKEEVQEAVAPEEPVVEYDIDELLAKDYSSNNAVVESISNEPKVEEVPKSKYTNDKKLSDIFGKKENTTRNIETTQDFSDELDRILQKLNNEETPNEDESTDYTNMF